MNHAQKIFCDGAAMAYRDCGNKLLKLIDESPQELRGMLEGLRPFANACILKASTVHDEAKKAVSGKRH